jgi:phosphoglycerate dehydrogenase-like enzyme
VLVPEAIERNLTVTNSRGVFDQGIAEYVLGAVLAFAKDFPGTLRRQQDRTWEHRATEPVAGRRLLVVGAGSIGSAVGRLAMAAGLEVRGVARSERADDPVFGHVIAQADLLDVLPWADFVVLTVPLSDETRGLIDGAALSVMRHDARLINVARGGVVDERALVEALEAGRLAGALLDVFATEPLPDASPFWSMPNVIVSPHMSGDLHGWVEALTELFVDNYRRWRAEEPLRNVVQG